MGVVEIIEARSNKVELEAEKANIKQIMDQIKNIFTTDDKKITI
jgi:hypothetical protein